MLLYNETEKNRKSKQKWSYRAHIFILFVHQTHSGCIANDLTTNWMVQFHALQLVTYTFFVSVKYVVESVFFSSFFFFIFFAASCVCQPHVSISSKHNCSLDFSIASTKAKKLFFLVCQITFLGILQFCFICFCWSFVSEFSFSNNWVFCKAIFHCINKISFRTFQKPILINYITSMECCTQCNVCLCTNMCCLFEMSNGMRVTAKITSSIRDD